MEESENVGGEDGKLGVKKLVVEKKQELFGFDTQVTQKRHELIMDPYLQQKITKDENDLVDEAFKMLVPKKSKIDEIPASQINLLLRGLGRNPHPEQTSKWLKELTVDPVEGTVPKKWCKLMLKQPELKKVDSELVLREAFRTFDLHETGEIDPKEFKEIMLNYGDKSIMTEKEITQFVSEATDSTTHTITYFDYISSMMKALKPPTASKRKRKSKKGKSGKQ